MFWQHDAKTLVAYPLGCDRKTADNLKVCEMSAFSVAKCTKTKTKVAAKTKTKVAAVVRRKKPLRHGGKEGLSPSSGTFALMCRLCVDFFFGLSVFCVS